MIRGLQVVLQGKIDIFFDRSWPQFFDQLFRLRDGAGRSLQNRIRELLRFFHQIVGWNDTIDQSDFLRAPCVDQFRAKQKLAHVSFADLPAQKSHDEAGNEPAPYFGVTDFGSLSGNDEIARRH